MTLFVNTITIIVLLLLVMWTNHWVIEETEVDE